MGKSCSVSFSLSLFSFFCVFIFVFHVFTTNMSFFVTHTHVFNNFLSTSVRACVYFFSIPSPILHDRFLHYPMLPLARGVSSCVSIGACCAREGDALRKCALLYTLLSSSDNFYQIPGMRKRKYEISAFEN